MVHNNPYPLSIDIPLNYEYTYQVEFDPSSWRETLFKLNSNTCLGGKLFQVVFEPIYLYYSNPQAVSTDSPKIDLSLEFGLMKL